MNKNRARLFDIRHFPLDFGRIVCSPMALFMRVRKKYLTPDAKKKIRGGAIIVANHTCFSDPIIVGCTFWYRRMFFLVAEVVMKKKFLSTMLKGAGCIKIDRNICDMEAIRKTISLLKEGHTVTVFPQGGIDRQEDVQSIKSGAILMALQAKVPIVPVFVHKRNKQDKRNVVVIGEPVRAHIPDDGGMASMADISKATELVLERMQECRAYYENEKRGK